MTLMATDRTRISMSGTREADDDDDQVRMGDEARMAAPDDDGKPHKRATKRKGDMPHDTHVESMRL